MGSKRVPEGLGSQADELGEKLERGAELVSREARATPDVSTGAEVKAREGSDTSTTTTQASADPMQWLKNITWFLAEQMLQTGKAHALAAAPYQRLHLWLGLPATVLAAVAGVSALTDQELIAGVLAIAVAVLASMTTYLNPSGTAAQHLDRAAQCRSVAWRINIFYNRLFELKADALLEPRWKELQDLQKQGEEAMGLPHPPERYFREVKKQVEQKNEALFERMDTT
jgi:hypothetical protein